MVIVAPDAANAAATWRPMVGDETRALLRTAAPPESHDRIIQSACSILSKGVSPWAAAGHETGLVIGHVQSGKTLSFETVTALARENLYPIVVVIAGTTIPLFNQSSSRLERDLRLAERPDRKWQLFKFNGDVQQESMLNAMRGVLADWADGAVPDSDKKTVLITVMKHHGWLDQLRQLLQRLDLRAKPTLIIDDEADQASLNTQVNSGNQSTTYRRINELRAAIPHHTFLQYTATPQAPLLINIIDALSPNFVEVLIPGDGYIGGRDFFIDLMATHVRTIPPQDVPTQANVLTEPPQSLLEALRLFMVGMAAHLVVHGDRSHRSMLVHPSHRTAPHHDFFVWVQQVFNNWQRILTLPADDPDHRDLIADFGVAYDDLSQTVEDLPAFERIRGQLLRAFRNTTVMEINATPGKTPTVPWRNGLGWILVGGQAMDRGFTIEGLTVTYMPRGIGVGNADTVQQRGRFFGYKREYVGYCRVFLEAGVMAAFHDYVEHEEEIRAQLEDYQRRGQPLSGWKRAFILSGALRPTRQNVLDLDYMRGRFSSQWFEPKYLLVGQDIADSNRTSVERFLAGLALAPDEGDQRRTDTQRHNVALDVSLRSVVSNLLIDYRLTELRDSQHFTGLLLQLSRALDRDPDERCTIFQMSQGRPRERAVTTKDGKIVSQLFQGANPSTGADQGSIYPGDRQIRTGDRVTLQIHKLNLTDGTNGPVIARDVMVLGVWVPRRLGASWLVQDPA